MKRKFYLYKDEVWMSESRELRFSKVSDPKATLKYACLNPDEVESFAEIRPSPETYRKDAPEERLYRIITDTSTVVFLNEQSFWDIHSNVSSYLKEIEEWERLCVVRDIGRFYKNHKEKRKADIEKVINSHEKPAAE